MLTAVRAREEEEVRTMYMERKSIDMGLKVAFVTDPDSGAEKTEVEQKVDEESRNITDGIGFGGMATKDIESGEGGKVVSCDDTTDCKEVLGDDIGRTEQATRRHKKAGQDGEQNIDRRETTDRDEHPTLTLERTKTFLTEIDATSEPGEIHFEPPANNHKRRTESAAAILNQDDALADTPIGRCNHDFQ